MKQISPLWFAVNSVDPHIKILIKSIDGGAIHKYMAYDSELTINEAIEKFKQQELEASAL